jgi:DNA-binding MarR family transcriptional regulator
VDNAIGAQILATFSSIIRSSRVPETPAGATDDVPASVLAVLTVLAENGELRLGSLATGLGLDTSVISRTVAVAVDRGLVARRRDPRDGRACLLSLTRRGRRCLTDRCNRRLRLLAAVMDEWEPGSAEALLAGLNRLRDGLAAARTASVGGSPGALAHPASATA